MKQKRIKISIIVLVLVMTTITLAKSFPVSENFWDIVSSVSNQHISETSNKENHSQIKNNEKQVENLEVSHTTGKNLNLGTGDSDHVLYHLLFNLVRIYDYEATQLDLSGGNGSFLRTYFQVQGNLTNSEFIILKQVAHDHAVEMAPIHSRAMGIITEYRGSVPNEEPITDSPREIPAELDDLEAQRNSLALNYRDELQTRLGEEAFTRFTLGIQKNFVPQLQVAEENPYYLSNPNDNVNLTTPPVNNKKGGNQ